MGTLECAKTGLIFTAKFFGIHTKKSLPYTSILKASQVEEEENNVLRIIYKKQAKALEKKLEYQMKNSNDLYKSIEVICSYIQRAAKSSEVTMTATTATTNTNAAVEENNDSRAFHLKPKDWSLLLESGTQLYVFSLYSHSLRNNCELNNDDNDDD